MDEITSTTQDTQTVTQPATAEPGTYSQAQLERIVSEREQRAGNAALKSFFRQQGMSEEEVSEAVAQYKQARRDSQSDVDVLTAQLREAQQATMRSQLEYQAAMHALKLGVDVSTVPYLLRLADLGDVRDESGAVSEERLTQALEKVLTDLPALRSEKTQSQGFVQIGAAQQNEADAQAAADTRLRRAFGLKN